MSASKKKHTEPKPEGPSKRQARKRMMVAIIAGVLAFLLFASTVASGLMYAFA